VERIYEKGGFKPGLKREEITSDLKRVNECSVANCIPLLI